MVEQFKESNIWKKLNVKIALPVANEWALFSRKKRYWILWFSKINESLEKLYEKISSSRPRTLKSTDNTNWIIHQNDALGSSTKNYCFNIQRNDESAWFDRKLNEKVYQMFKEMAGIRYVHLLKLVK